MTVVDMPVGAPAVSSPATPGRVWGAVSGLAIGHMVVDATSIIAGTSIAVAAYDRGDVEAGKWAIVAYNFLAFAPQFALGWLVDLVRMPHLAAAAGALMAAAGAVLWPYAPMLALVLAGLGNAVYHVAGGATVLGFSRGRAAHGGAFVGPGDMGVVLGAFAGAGLWPGGMVIVGACVAVALFAVLVPRWAREDRPIDPALRARPGWALGAAAVVLLAIAVACRSTIGGGVGGQWLPIHWAWITLAVTAMAGKIAWGFVADRAGLWIAVPMTAAAAVFVYFSRGDFSSSFAVAVLVQSAMPVTLAALYRLMPSRPALAFGIAGSAIWVGSAPALLGLTPLPAAALAGVQVAAAAAIGVALWAGRGSELVPGR